MYITNISYFSEVEGRRTVLCFRNMASYTVNDKWYYSDKKGNYLPSVDIVCTNVLEESMMLRPERLIYNTELLNSTWCWELSMIKKTWGRFKVVLSIRAFSSQPNKTVLCHLF